MSKWRVKKGNASIQDIPIYDRDGALLTKAKLASATEIIFQVKATRDAASAVIEKKLSDAEIEINAPSDGWIRISLLPADTNIAEDYYVMALEITFSETEKYEAILKIDDMETDTFQIEEQVII